MRATAAQLIRDMGKAATLRVPGADTFDPVTGASVPGSPTDYATYAVETPMNTLTLWNAMIDKLGVESGEFFLLVAGVDSSGAALPMPRTEHELYLGSVATGQRLYILGARASKPADVAIMYEVRCRG